MSLAQPAISWGAILDSPSRAQRWEREGIEPGLTSPPHCVVLGWSLCLPGLTSRTPPASVKCLPDLPLLQAGLRPRRLRRLQLSGRGESPCTTHQVALGGTVSPSPQGLFPTPLPQAPNTQNSELWAGLFSAIVRWSRAPQGLGVCVCVCVCVRSRNRERDRERE